MYFQTHRYVRGDCLGLYSLLGPTLLRARRQHINSIPQVSIGCWKVQLFWLGKNSNELATNSQQSAVAILLRSSTWKMYTDKNSHRSLFRSYMFMVTTWPCEIDTRRNASRKAFLISTIRERESRWCDDVPQNWNIGTNFIFYGP